eukprot:EG_transcript_5432
MGELFSQLERRGSLPGPILLPMSPLPLPAAPCAVSPTPTPPPGPPSLATLPSSVPPTSSSSVSSPSPAPAPASPIAFATSEVADPTPFLTVPDPHPSLPPLEAVDLTFSTHLQLGLQHQRVVANDELAYLLDGASPKWPSAARIPALHSLRQWLAGAEATAHVRAESQLPALLRAAAEFDPADRPLAAACLGVLVAVATDPSNHHAIDAAVWHAFLSVLSPRPAPLTSTLPTDDFSEVFSMDSSGTDDEPAAKRRCATNLCRKRTFLRSLQPIASQRNSCGDFPVDEEVECLALTGLIGSLIALSGDSGSAVDQDAGPPRWVATAPALRAWLRAANGPAVLQRRLSKHVQRWATAAAVGADRPAALLLRLLELLTCAAPEADGGDAEDAGWREALRDLLPPLVDALAVLGPEVSPGPPVPRPGTKRGRALLPQVGRGTPAPPSMVAAMQARVLRVAINVCALCSQRPPSGTTLRGLIDTTAALLPSTSDVDVLTCGLCLLVNVTEWDGIARTLAGAAPGLVPFVAAEFRRRLAPGTTGGNIVAAYCALLLGCLTIDHPANLSAVIAALQPGAASGRRPAAHPMVPVVAVLQEFVLFQSRAEVLTQSALQGLHHVITAVVEANALPVASA